MHCSLLPKNPKQGEKESLLLGVSAFGEGLGPGFLGFFVCLFVFPTSLIIRPWFLKAHLISSGQHTTLTLLINLTIN